jgi:four helix bundle protein
MENNQDKANVLENRLIEFVVSVIKLSGKLPKTDAGRHIARQVLRSGKSPAPNYGEARGAESRADFVHKLGIVLKELNETLIWLKIIKEGRLVTDGLLKEIVNENNQLAKIITASIKTVRNTIK